MIRTLLPIAAVLALAPAMPTLAQVCYQDDAGNVVDLGGLCDRTEDRRTPVEMQGASAPAAAPGADSSGFFHDVAATPFPTYLFDADPDNNAAHQTGQKPYVDSTIFVYQGRFVVVFTDWPYTYDPGNNAEWSYVDCQTGWRGLDEYPMVGSSDPFFIPPALTDSPDVYRSICTTAGVQPRF